MARPESFQVKRISDLPEEYLNQVHDMVSSTDPVIPATEIARIIQEEWSFNNDISRQALSRSVRRYRDKCGRSLWHKKVKMGALDPLTGKVKKLDAIKKIGTLIEYQQQRLQATMLTEASILESGAVLNITGAEIDRLSKLLEQYHKMLVSSGNIGGGEEMRDEYSNADSKEPITIDGSFIEAAKNSIDSSDILLPTGGDNE